jgi:cytochrome c-type biogenesis protein CcmH
MKQARYSAQLLLVTIVLTSLIAAIPLGVVNAQDSPPSGPSDDQVNAIAKQLYCPVCENIPLDVCPTQACAQWRELIREKLSEGWTEKEIKTYFVAQYGDRVLATPPATGLNWLVYIVPPLVIILGAYILYRALSAWRQPLAKVTEQNLPNIEADDEYVARIEEELRRQ